MKRALERLLGVQPELHYRRALERRGERKQRLLPVD